MGIIIAIYVCGFLISGAIMNLDKQKLLKDATIDDLYDKFDEVSQDGVHIRSHGVIYTFTRQKADEADR